MKSKETLKNGLAAIDVGSNAIRLMIATYSKNEFCAVKKYRTPIRLGSDVFEKGKISGKKLRDSARAFQKFKQIIDRYGIKKIRAVGTSALREAKNTEAFVELIRRKSGIKIEIIDGLEEAQLIYLAVKKEVKVESHDCLLIDIGGGSIELTFSDKGRSTSAQSFPFGTVRTLQKLKTKKLLENQIRVIIGEYLQPLSLFIAAHNPGKKIDFAIGTGGNLEAIGRMKTKLLNKHTNNSVSIGELNDIIEKLSRMTHQERITKLKLRTDRADVILPAAIITQSCMRLAGIDRILIPYVGLKDGLLWSMIEFTQKI